MQERVEIQTEMIQLGKFLQKSNVIDTGGMAKWFLSEYVVTVNGERDNRRGRKLYDGDVVEIEGIGSYVVVEEK
ncbi:S4 domain-containing protein YaaA [Pontibacillus litoralis]|uniref:Uncharacterized protein n=1 Tax=Pontibacillus litoralis JSM 072002 TaxID=1385512 RepID=A0A0A5FXY0_9BACI|nr:S4 domain-containing protein YaaA [Pontibacillus litoralis]KGX85676.1 hypothetical protein N784_08415 [Pontibacillus litoralis JSM 072002]